ncbi:MAG TPA: FAD-dependent monooxygenase [Bryobacteraceae bacterium]|nr:FAD-dependent monooxygenase [Bryobacteraceae bacterium]
MLVVGGGPAGLAAAIAARRQGLEVTVADHAVPPVNKACGEGIMPDGLAAALDLGIRIDESLGHRFRGIRFCEGGLAVDAPFPAGPGLGIRRTVLHRVLIEHAAALGVHFAWGSRVRLIDWETVAVNGSVVRARWIIGADGGQSRVRNWAKLEATTRSSLRFGFRRHCRMAPWGEHMEIHWSPNGQLYITPTAAEELCVVLISRDPHDRLETALPQFPEAAARLAGATWVGGERGGASVTRRLRSVYRNNVALIGDASGSVDAITGEGLCLLFQQAAAMGTALAAGDLALYQREHRRIGRRPAVMSDFMLLLDGAGRNCLRARVLRAFAAQPELFRRMLEMHVGRWTPAAFAANSLALGWRMLRG